MKNIEKWEQGENLAQMIDYRLYGKPSGKAGELVGQIWTAT
jgi:hypothetical protein